MRDLAVRPFKPGDELVLDQGLRSFTEAELELPHGYWSENVETAVVTKGEAIVGSLTGTLVLVLDPFLKAPGFSPQDYAGAIIKSEAILTYRALEAGAVDAYLAIPEGATPEGRAAAQAFIQFALKSGYEETIQHCRIFRRALRSEPSVSDKLTNEVPNDAPPDMVSSEI